MYTKTILTLLLLIASLLIIAVDPNEDYITIQNPSDGGGANIDLGKAVKITSSGVIDECNDNDDAVIGIVLTRRDDYYHIVNSGIALSQLPATVSAGDELTTAASGFLRKANAGEVVVGTALDNGDSDPDFERVIVSIGSKATSGDYIMNQYTSAQTGNFWISGKGRIVDSLTVQGITKLDNSLYLGNVPAVTSADSILTLSGGQVKKVAATGINDGDWSRSGSNVYTYNTTDNVGIGTASPSDKLHLETNNASSNIRFVTKSDTPGDRSALMLYHVGSSGGATPDTAKLGTILFRGMGTSSEFVGALIDGYLSGPVGTDNARSYLRFVTNNGTGINEVMKLDYNGNVGIGTSSPTLRLDVNGNVKVGDTLVIGKVANNTVNDSILVLSNSGRVGWVSKSTISNSSGWTDAGTVVRLITSTDSVGIGTATPTQPFDVNGKVRIRNLPVGTITDSLVTTDVNGNLRKIATTSVSDTDFARSGNKLTTWTTNDSLGVGVSPSTKFDVNGQARIRTIPSGATTDSVLTADTNGNIRWRSVAAFPGNGWTDDGTVVRLTTSTDSVGVGTTAPTQPLDVNGGVRVRGGTSLPTASASLRGTIFTLQGSGATTDKIYICARTSTGTYVWVLIGRGD